jgi:hypothetical protein
MKNQIDSLTSNNYKFSNIRNTEIIYNNNNENNNNNNENNKLNNKIKYYENKENNINIYINQNK